VEVILSSITEKIAAAKAAPRNTLEVVVSLAKDLSEQRAALEAELAAAKDSNDDRLGAPTAASVVQDKLDEILALEADSLITLRFTKLPGDAWTNLTRLCPPDAESLIDMHYKFDLNAVCKLAAQYVDSAGTAYGHVVEGDGLTSLTSSDWVDLFAELSGPEFTAVVDTIYSLNLYGPAARYKELLKISASLTA
jgi:hypothetical protein